MSRNTISDLLLDWYETHRRELPWRQTRDPYRIWISEVILQQTRVAQGLAYYLRFTERFPDVQSLAEADIDEVLKYWQGLGYYSRARSLHTAAKEIMERFGGQFPERYEEVRSLKGVGDYTAAAVCSIAYGLPYATVDGNVYRVLSRLFDLDLPIDTTEGRKHFAALANELLDRTEPGRYNQALMELGALQCLPRRPDCRQCPLSERCLAWASGSERVEQLPVKSPKKAVKARYFNYFRVHCAGQTLLARREEKDIWQHLYEFPLIETEAAIEYDRLRESEAYQRLFGGGEERIWRVTDMPPHVLSHRVIHARFYEVEVPTLTTGLERYLRIDETALGDYAVSRLIESYLQREQTPQLPFPAEETSR